MPSANQDWDFLQAALPELKTYLLSDELFWPLGGRNRLRLTPGNLLLARQRLAARALSPVDEARLIKWDQEFETLLVKWPVAWEKKVAHEFASRLRQWRNYLEDYRRAPDACAADYPYEVRLRVILELLGEETDLDATDRGLLAGLDTQLRADFLPGDFLWEADLQPAFPRETYWYLYGRLREK